MLHIKTAHEVHTDRVRTARTISQAVGGTRLRLRLFKQGILDSGAGDRIHYHSYASYWPTHRVTTRKKPVSELVKIYESEIRLRGSRQ